MPREFNESEVIRRKEGTLGGTFAEFIHSKPEAILGQPATPGDPAVAKLLERRRQLRDAGYIPAGSGPATGPVKSTAGRHKWWETHFARAEFAPEKSYHQMPDDYTPKQTAGRALSENRRTHRMLYSGGGVSVRMPSATAIKRYAKEINNQTFDVPVEAEYPGGTISGFVRVTRNGVGEWSVSGVNMPNPGNSYVSEAVSAVLEDRRPSRALSQVEDLMARRRQRIAAAGVKIKPVENSAWIRGMGYNTADQQMVIDLNGRKYGYHVSAGVYEEASKNWSAGRIYNKLVKGQARFEVELHEKCGRHYDVSKPHRCASEHRAATATVKLHNLRVKQHVLANAH